MALTLVSKLPSYTFFGGNVVALTLISKLPSYAFYRGNVVRVLVNFFFLTAAHFHLGGRQHFSFSHCRYKFFMLFFQPKMSPLFFISRFSSLSRFFSLSFVGLSPTSSFPCHSLSLYSNFVDMNINLSSILKTTRIQNQFPLSVFVFIDSLIVSASQDGSGYAISRQNNLELHLGCHTC